jgi:hypothetical protein
MSGRFTASYRIALFRYRGWAFHGRVFVSQLSSMRAAFRESPGFSPFNQRKAYAYEVLTGGRYYVNCDQIRRSSHWACMSEVGEGMGVMGEQNGAMVPEAFTNGLDEAVSNFGSPALLDPAAATRGMTPAPMFLSHGRVNGRVVQCLSIGNVAGAVGRVCTMRSGVITSYRFAQPQGNDYASAQLISYTTKVNPRAVNPPAVPLAPGK